jgi:UDP-2-acetamido-3-amino-2,3-dideoxy-glucuronate N-acetyltransferase
MKNPRVAVVGLGAWGRRAARGLQAMGALAAVCDLDPTRTADFDVPAFQDYLALLSAGLVDAVALGTPSGTRYAMGLGALHADLDLWVKAPLASASEAGRALVEAAAAHARVLHLDGFEDVHAVLSDAALGAPRYVDLRDDARGTLEDLQERLVCAVTTVQALLGEAPTRVRAEGIAIEQTDAADVIVAHLQFESRARASLHVSRVHPLPNWRLSVIGSGAAAEGPTRVEGGGGARAAAFVEAVSARGENGAARAALSALRTTEAVRRALDEDRWVSPGEAPALAPATAPADVYLHPSVAVSGPVNIGAGTKIWHFSKLLGPLTIGERCTLGQNVVVERHVTVGNNVKIQNNVSVYSGVVLEDDVFCGPSMVFTNVGTPRSHYPRRGTYQETRVRRGASIGANATVVCGNTLGAYCFVGAGSVVTRPVPDYALVFGNPARVRGWACYCGERLPLGADLEGSETGQCGHCDRRYTREGHTVTPLEAEA